MDQGQVAIMVIKGIYVQASDTIEVTQLKGHIDLGFLAFCAVDKRVCCDVGKMFQKQTIMIHTNTSRSCEALRRKCVRFAFKFPAHAFPTVKSDQGRPLLQDGITLFLCFTRAILKGTGHLWLLSKTSLLTQCISTFAKNNKPGKT